jgi:predicted acyl esterase
LGAGGGRGEIFPPIAPDHRLRLTVSSYDFPNLVPTKPARRALAAPDALS